MRSSYIGPKKIKVLKKKKKTKCEIINIGLVESNPVLKCCWTVKSQALQTGKKEGKKKKKKR